MTETYSVNDHFVHKDPSVRALHDELLSILQTFGLVAEDPKKISIHLNRKSALAGVETRKDGLLLNIRSRARALKKQSKFRQNDFITRYASPHQRIWMRNFKIGLGKHTFFQSSLVSQVNLSDFSKKNAKDR